MPYEEVGPGIFRLGNRTVNWWAVVRPEGVTLIDAGLPKHLAQLRSLLEHLGRSMSEIRALLLTHADLDHIGFAERLRRDGVEAFIHESDAAAAGGAFRPLPPQALLNAWRPRMLVGAFEYARDGVLRSRPVSGTVPLTDGDRLSVPGRPVVVHVPGHTPGSCALLFEDEGALFTGDALVTMDPLSGKKGPGLLAAYDNQDQGQATTSLELLLATDAALVLPGHGDEWNRQGTPARPR